MAIVLPTPLSRDWDAVKLWDSAVRDFPPDAIATLFDGEWQNLMNRSISETAQKFRPLIGQTWMTRALLTQVDGEIDISSLRVDISDFRRIKLTATLAPVMTLSDLIDLNSQSFEQNVIVGEQWIDIPQNVLGAYIFDRIEIDGNPSGWEIKVIEPTRFRLNVLIAGNLRVEIGRVGSKLAGGTIVNTNTYVQPMKFRIRANLVTGLNTVVYVVGGNPVTMVGDYEIGGIQIGDGTEVLEQNSTSMVVNALAPVTIEREIRGSAIFGGTIINLYEQRMKVDLPIVGANVVTFPIMFPSDYAILTDITYNASGGIIGHDISGRTLSGLTVTPLAVCTLMLRVGELGASYESLPIAPVSSTTMVLAQTEEEFISFRPSAKHNERTGIFWFGESDTLFIKKGNGFKWQSFIAHYPRLPYLITSASSVPDLPDGMYMNYARLQLQENIAARLQLTKDVSHWAAMKTQMEREIYVQAGVSIRTETAQGQNIRLTQ